MSNGYKERNAKCAEGRFPVFIPQIRDADQTYASRLWQFVKGNSDVFRYLVAEMYAKPVYQRYLRPPLPMNRVTSVSEVTEALWEDYLAFSQRDLSGFEVALLRCRL